jgi:hypothetical protein
VWAPARHPRRNRQARLATRGDVRLGARGIGLLAHLLLDRGIDRRKQAEVHVHRLIGIGLGIAGDMAQQGAQRGGGRRRRPCPPSQFGSGHQAREHADRGAFDIAFAAGDLPGKADVRRRFQAQLPVQQRGRMDEGVAVQPAQARELGIFQAGNGAEQSHLLGMLELGLEADHVPQGAQLVVLAQLHHGIGPAPGARVVQPHRLHRAKAQGVLARSAITSIGMQPSK